MMGEKPTNKPIAWTEIHVYCIKGGKIKEHWAEISTMELFQQMGILPQLA
jgi:predicted ester cyclase